MSVIRILPEIVVNKIAAGEVVERPASVVKELVENSVDAGAGLIQVSVESGGKRLIRVVDDGCGMSHDDALLAFERHATSKIHSAEDIFEISTLGFRGEALPSMAAVSRLVLETRHASESSGTRLEIAGGKLRDVKEVAWEAGTRVEVRDLFYNTPARRKFLKSESTELGHIASLVTHYALAHPDKGFRLTSLNNEILQVSPVSSLRERVYQVMGAQTLEQLIEIAPVERRMVVPAPPGIEEEGESAAEAPLVRVFGFTSRPEVHKLNRNNIYFFVNRRLVRDRLILHAITEAYRNILPASVFPVALIFLELPAVEVDVNVHPSKVEVRFRHSGFVHDLVRDSLRQALLATRPVASFPMGRSSREVPVETDAAEVAEKLAEEAARQGVQDPLIGPPPQSRAGTPSHDSRGAPWQPRTGTPSQVRTGTPWRAPTPFKLSSPEPVPRTGQLPLEAALSPYAPAASRFEADSRVLQATPYDIAPPGELPADLQPLGQVQESFIVATNPAGLWVVDQHAAHERVLFDRHVRMRQEKKVSVQRLLVPIILELRAEQQVTYQEIAEELAANGFEVEPFGQRTLAIKAAPAETRADDVGDLMREILDNARQEGRTVSLDILRNKIAASVSCHAAIKVNMPLDRSKMDWLLQSLAQTECPMTCPHGRPTVLRYGMKDLQKAFKRI
ncbi:MAG: DNA mismatch repair endonuclease MutL [Terriglobia bacterium]|jgi:DNA mismatch repair protein MutL